MTDDTLIAESHAAAGTGRLVVTLASTGTLAATAAALASGAQRRLMYALFGQLGVVDRGQRLAATGAIVGRAIDTSAVLTREETSVLIDALIGHQADINTQEEQP